MIVQVYRCIIILFVERTAWFEVSAIAKCVMLDQAVKVCQTPAPISSIFGLVGRVRAAQCVAASLFFPDLVDDTIQVTFIF